MVPQVYLFSLIFYLNVLSTTRLVTKGTVDEDIYSIAKRKLILDAAVLETGTEVDDNNNENEVLRMGAILSAILDAAPS